MRRLDRYLLSEVLGPLGLGFLVYTSILLVQLLFRLAEMIIRRGLGLRVVGELLVLSLPNIVVLTIPMALLFGILIAVGRLASDSELIALRSCGVSLFALYRPILLLSAALAALNLWLCAWALPRGNHAYQQLTLEIFTQTVSQQVEPRVFYTEWPDKVLYVFEAPPGGRRWHGVFLADAVPMPQNEVIFAEWGELRLAGDGEKVVLHLENALKHAVDFNSPQKYEISRHRSLEVLVEDRFTSSRRAKIVASKGMRELTIPELRKRSADPEQSLEMRRLARVEIHKKFAIPAACLVFGLLALPMGFNNRRGSKSSGFALSIGVILVYWVFLHQGEQTARLGEISPALAMWLPNLLLTAVGLALLVMRNRDRRLAGGLLNHFELWRMRRRRAAEEAWSGKDRRRPARKGMAQAIVLRLPRLRLRFPNLLDRYVLRSFGWILLLVLLSGVVLAIVADFTQTVDEILKNQIGSRTVLDYYKYFSLQIVFDIAPIIVLVTTLITFSLLERTNEITACKALGTSLFRLAFPAVVAGAAVAVFSVMLQAWVLPAANQRAAELRDEIKNRNSAQRVVRRANQQWLFGEGHFIYNYLRYDPRSYALDRLQVFEFDDQRQLVGRLVAGAARWTESGWILDQGWARGFSGLDVTRYQAIAEPVRSDFPERPELFAAEMRRPQELALRELGAYVRELKESGQPVPELEVAYQNRIAFPVASVVMVLVALPFGFRLGRRGALYGLGMAIVLGMVFLGIFAFFRTLGEVGAFPPLVAVWSPSVLFALLSGYLFLGVRT